MRRCSLSNSVDLPVLATKAGAWTHVVIDMTLTAPGSIAISFDGTSVLSTGLSSPPSSGQVLSIGITEYLATVAAMHFDSFACNLTP